MCPEINTLIKEPLQFRRLKCLVSHTPLVVCITEKVYRRMKTRISEAPIRLSVSFQGRKAARRSLN